MSSALGMCETPGCKSIASLQCPTCLKIGIQGSYFCSQVSKKFILGYKPWKRASRKIIITFFSPRKNYLKIVHDTKTHLIQLTFHFNFFLL